MQWYGGVVWLGASNSLSRAIPWLQHPHSGHGTISSFTKLASSNVSILKKSPSLLSSPRNWTLNTRFYQTSCSLQSKSYYEKTFEDHDKTYGMMNSRGNFGTTKEGGKNIKPKKLSSGPKKLVSKSKSITKRSSRKSSSNPELSDWEIDMEDKEHFLIGGEPDFRDMNEPISSTNSQSSKSRSVETLASNIMASSQSDSSLALLTEENGESSLVPTSDKISELEKKMEFLGLTDLSLSVMKSGSKDIISEYVRQQDLTEEQMRALKYDQEEKPVLGSWKAEHTAARRVAQILTMPVYHEGPLYKGRDISLFTYDESEYFAKYVRNTKNYNSFIWKLAKQGKLKHANKAWMAMVSNEIPRDVATYTSLIVACWRKANVRMAMKYFVEMKKEQIQPDLWVFDILMETFIAAHEIEGAFALYDELKPNGLKPNPVIFTTLVKGCLKDKDFDRAFKVYGHMKTWHCEADTTMFNLMIYGSAMNGEAEKAMNYYEHMRSLGLRPTHATFNSLLWACARRKDYYEEAFKLLRVMKVEGYAPNYRTLDMLLAVTSRGGDVITAELIFDERIAMKDVPKREETYAFLIGAYAMAHKVHEQRMNRKEHREKAAMIFERMQSNGIKPTALSLNAMLSVFVANSMYQKALEWKSLYKSNYGVSPTFGTFNLMINLFARGRKMDLALDQFNLMIAENVKPRLSTYIALIKGCTRNHMATTGMKLLKEMKLKGFELKPEDHFVQNFRRDLVRTPDYIREIDELTGKAYRYVLPWRRPGRIKKITYFRELSKAEKKKTSLYG